jgi:elongation factor Tu
LIFFFSQVLELVEIEIRELLCDFGFDGEKCPIICGSALEALNGNESEIGEPSVRKLLEALDSYVPTPVRDVKSPFLLPIDNAFTIPGLYQKSQRKLIFYFNFLFVFSTL